MKKNIVYPAVFHPQDKGYWVSFPDLDGCLTEGETIEEALYMAQDALGVYFFDEVKFPNSSLPNSIQLEEEGAFVSMISLDLQEYRKKHSSKAIKKTLSIPEWLNIAAEKENVNFSQTLQDALIEKLGLQ